MGTHITSAEKPEAIRLKDLSFKGNGVWEGIDTRWSPYLSVDDARKLHDVRAALKRGDIKAAPTPQ
jgi:hypothetical protein